MPFSILEPGGPCRTSQCTDVGVRHGADAGVVYPGGYRGHIHLREGTTLPYPAYTTGYHHPAYTRHIPQGVPPTMGRRPVCASCTVLTMVRRPVCASLSLSS